MGRVFLVDLEGRTYRCRYCDSALALADHVLSRVFSFSSTIQRRLLLFPFSIIQFCGISNCSEPEMINLIGIRLNFRIFSFSEVVESWGNWLINFVELIVFSMLF